MMPTVRIEAIDRALATSCLTAVISATRARRCGRLRIMLSLSVLLTGIACRDASHTPVRTSSAPSGTSSATLAPFNESKFEDLRSTAIRVAGAHLNSVLTYNIYCNLLGEDEIVFHFRPREVGVFDGEVIVRMSQVSGKVLDIR